MHKHEKERLQKKNDSLKVNFSLQTYKLLS